jgi:predicted DNA-binding transcriptional regulator AlpA
MDQVSRKLMEMVLARLETTLGALERLERRLGQGVETVGRGAPAQNQTEFIDREEVCKCLGVSWQMVRRRIRMGRFPKQLYGRGKTARWKSTDLNLEGCQDRMRIPRALRQIRGIPPRR